MQLFVAQYWSHHCSLHSLEDYIQELVAHLPEEHLAELDFTQAALVLQNSSHVYSRKVEHLYDQVFRVLLQLSSNAAASDRRRTDVEDDFFAYDAQQDFLLLDDVLPVLEDEPPIDYGLTALPTPSTTRRLSLSRTEATLASTQQTNRYLEEGDLQLTGEGAPVDGTTGMIGMLLEQDEVVDQHPRVAVLAAPATTAAAGDDWAMAGHDDDDDDDHDDGPGFAMADDQDDADMTNNKRVTFAVPDYQRGKTKEDPWELLDPFASDGKKPKPLRKGNTIKLPPGLDTLPSDCVTGARTRKTQRRSPVVVEPSVPTMLASLATKTFQASVAARKRSFCQDDTEDTDDKVEMPTVPLKGLAFGQEFAYIAKATAKRKAAERRALRKQQMQTIEYDDGDDDNDDGGFAFGGDGDDDNDDNHYDNGGMYGNDDYGNTGLGSVDEVFNNDESAGKTFEELCRAHIAAFAKGAEKYMTETQLSKRVNEWHERLKPLLEEEEQREAFDIIKCGEAVIELVEQESMRAKARGEDSKTVAFRDVTLHRDKSDVCRMFLATLSLSNSGNVSIAQKSLDDMTIELLCSEIDHPMENYLAPSLSEQQV